MTTQQLPDLSKDVTFNHLAKAFLTDKNTTSAIETLEDTFERAFYDGAIKGVEAGYSLHCKERGSFDYTTEEARTRYHASLFDLAKEDETEYTIKRAIDDARLGSIEEDLCNLFLKGAQRGLAKGYEMDEENE